MSISRKLAFCFLILALAAMISSCGSDKPQDKEISPSNQKSSEVAPESGVPRDTAVYVLHIVPQKAYKGSTLSVVAEGFSLADARIAWKINGVPLPGQSSASFKADNVRKGETVQATAVVQGQEVVSDSVTIVNSAPEFEQIKILPETFKPGDTFFVEASASDADGDDVAISYEWLLNGASVSSDKAIGVPVKRGDQITIKLIASDGKESSQPAVLKRTVQNFPPVISEDSALRCDARTCSGHIIASDPDGDTLTYTLKKGPQQMTVDASSGSVKWEVPAAFIGNEVVSVAVSDGHGGESIKTFSVDVRK